MIPRRILLLEEVFAGPSGHIGILFLSGYYPPFHRYTDPNKPQRYTDPNKPQRYTDPNQTQRYEAPHG